MPGERDGERSALRGFLAGELDAISASEAAGCSVSEFLDLVGRLREAEAAVAAGGSAPGAPVDVEIPRLSVIVPMFNEEGNIGPLLERLVPVLEGIGTYEVVFVDDHSRDRSVELVLAARAANPCIKLVELARNFGHQGALAAGIDHAIGEAVVMMDADLQDPPEVLVGMVERWEQGDEVVYAVREKRKEGPVLRASFYLFYRLLARVSEVEVPVDSGDFCLMDRRVVTAVRALPESNRFLRGLRAWVGFRQSGIEYERSARLAGETKYSIADRFRFAIDGLLAFSDLPLRLASLLGYLTTFVAVIYLFVAVFARLFGGEVPQGWTSIIFVVLIVGGVQLIMMGVMGEYLSRTYQEAKRRPSYVARATHGAHRVDEVHRG